MIRGLQEDLKVFNVKSGDFLPRALDIFRFQASANQVYRSYLATLKVEVSSIDSLAKIPFLPIRFFKTHSVVSGEGEAGLVFESSATTGATVSRHYVKDPGIYEESVLRNFEINYGPASDLCIIGLLPSYLERKNSSLVYMVDHLIKRTKHPASGFYLDEFKQLAKTLKDLEEKKQKTLLIGVSFALLDFAEQFPLPLQHTIVMETGGMKGRRKELIREELHAHLKKAFGLSSVHSEYGMTELLSQAYSTADGIFQAPPWLKVLARDEEDPLSIRVPADQPVSGALNIIDLANIYSCSFIATDDIGRVYPDGRFEVLGRMDASDLRGCSLMIPDFNE